MLTKEECELALSLMCKGKKSKYIHGDGITAYGVISQLINEYFELVKENEELKNQLGEIESSLSRVSTQEKSNPPLKFEELKPNMWVWDNKEKEYIKLRVINKILYYGNDEEYRVGDYIKFEENRFYLREVKEDECMD